MAASESEFFVHLSALSDEYERMRQENQSLKQELSRETSTPKTSLSWAKPEASTEKEANSAEDLPKEEKHHEDSESMRSIDTDPTDGLPVAPLAVEAAPPPPDVPHPHAPEGSGAPSSPSALKKTRITLDPADLTLPTTEKQRQTSFDEASDTPTPNTPTGEIEEVNKRKSTATRYSYVKDMQIQEHEDREDNANFFLMLDVVPAIVIMLSAVVAGVSADNDPNNAFWKVLEILFTLFFIAEVIVKLRVFGWKPFLWGLEWYWSWFDILCIILAVVDMAITYASLAADREASASALSSLKTLKLARLGRIVRLLKFKIFTELKLMIQGVFTGLRVLFWAIVLLVTCMYLIGIVAVTIFADDGGAEFSSVSAAMFTAFRCFTDGCAATDGTPLQETLRQKYGFTFMMVYILLFLFVTIGIFNLIMAVFIDNVTDGCTKKRQRELGQNAPKNAWRIAATLRGIILQKVLRKEAEDQAAQEALYGPPGTARRVSKILREKLEDLRGRYGKPHSTYEYADLTDRIREDMAELDVVVTRDEFNHWLASHEGLLDTLEDAEIDLSCKSDLFDVLDADMSGELEFEEMIDGLLKCRGPASKTDIIAIRLKARLLVRMMTAICSKLGIKDV